MKTFKIALYLLSLALVSCGSMPTIVGGYSPVSTNNKEVVSTAKFAITKQNEGLPEVQKIYLSRIISAQQQVVSGFNYKLNLEVHDQRRVEAIVWSQPWEQQPYKLTSWVWK